MPSLWMLIFGGATGVAARGATGAVWRGAGWFVTARDEDGSPGASPFVVVAGNGMTSGTTVSVDIVVATLGTSYVSPVRAVLAGSEGQRTRTAMIALHAWPPR